MSRALPGVFVAALSMSLAAPAGAAIGGTYSSPLGKLRLKEKNGVVTGTSAGKGPCGFKKGKKVFEGSVLDDSVTGTLTACKLGDGCSGAVDGVAMLLVTQRGRVLSGAVHLETGACKSPLQGDSITIRKPKPKPKAGGTTKTAGGASAATTRADPGGKTAKPPKGVGPREHAMSLAAAASGMMEGGKIEEARAKFIESVQVDPTYSQGHVGVGVTYYLRDRYDEALTHYKAGLEADPGNRDAYYNMACVYALKGEKEQALRYLQIAVLNGYVELDTFASDPDLKSLHGDADFEALKGPG
jgi:hypothetical protein